MIHFLPTKIPLFATGPVSPWSVETVFQFLPLEYRYSLWKIVTDHKICIGIKPALNPGMHHYDILFIEGL